MKLAKEQPVLLLAGLLVLLNLSFIFNDNQKKPVDHSGLVLPGSFKATVVADSLNGSARHLAVNTNGDIYVKLRFPDSIGGNAALRDTNGDGRADIIRKFGNYEDKGSYGTSMRCTMAICISVPR